MDVVYFDTKRLCPEKYQEASEVVRGYMDRTDELQNLAYKDGYMCGVRNFGKLTFEECREKGGEKNGV